MLLDADGVVSSFGKVLPFYHLEATGRRRGSWIHGSEALRV